MGVIGYGQSNSLIQRLRRLGDRDREKEKDARGIERRDTKTQRGRYTREETERCRLKDREKERYREKKRKKGRGPEREGGRVEAGKEGERLSKGRRKKKAGDYSGDNGRFEGNSTKRRRWKMSSWLPVSVSERLKRK